jgi:hypothetical protein
MRQFLRVEERLTNQSHAAGEPLPRTLFHCDSSFIHMCVLPLAPCHRLNRRYLQVRLASCAFAAPLGLKQTL